MTSRPPLERSRRLRRRVFWILAVLLLLGATAFVAAEWVWFGTARDWARVGLLIQLRGRAGGKQVVPAEYLATMRTPSPLEPDYGLHVWLGNEGIRTEEDDHDEPFEADDLVYLDGKHRQRVYVIPSRELVIVRVGERAEDWDDSFLPNLLGRALGDAGR